MTTPTRINEGFSVSHAAILDGSTGAETADIYGVREGSIGIESDAYENTGDDVVLSNWFWFTYATLAISSGYVPFDVIALLTGANVASSGTGAATVNSLPLWNESSNNQPARPVLVRVPSKDSAGAIRRLDFVLFRVQFQPISFDGPTYKDGLVLNYAGRAVVSDVDETGQSISERAVGRLVDRPAA